MKKQDYLNYCRENSLYKYNEFDGWNVKIFVEDEESNDKWYTLVSTTEENANIAFDFFASKFKGEKIRLIAPSHLSRSIWKEI